jgi:solute carrier family 50 protein (sugar transporter)
MTDSIFPLFATSLFGEIIATFYTIVYFIYSPNRKYVLQTVAVGAAVFIVMTAYVILGITGVTHQSIKQVYTVEGWVSIAINIFMYASPLEKVRLVIQSKNSSSIPINLSVMIFINCCLWVATAVVDSDMFVLIPNIVGVLFTAFQIVLYFVYRPPKSISKDELVEIVAGDFGNAVEPIVSPVISFEPLRSPLAPLRS